MSTSIVIADRPFQILCYGKFTELAGGKKWDRQ